jgi:hypothetical protein
LQRGEPEELVHAVGLDDDVLASDEGDWDPKRIFDARDRAVHTAQRRADALMARHGCFPKKKRPRSAPTHGVCGSASLDPDPTRARGGRTSQQRRAK